jgi:hypothetical protein
MRTVGNCLAIAAAAVLFAGCAKAEPPAEQTTQKSIGPKSYQIENKKYSRLLRPKDANGDDGTPIVLYPAQSWKCLTWELAPVGSDEFTLRNHFTSKTFAAAEGSDRPIVQVPFAKDAAKAVKWRVTKLPDGSYRIADPKSGAALTAVDDKDGGYRIVLSPWADKDEQKWTLHPTDPAKLTM